MKKKLLIILPVLLIIVAVAGYEFVMPKKAAAKPHLVGTVVPLASSFTLNLAGGHYATLSVALLVPALPKTGLADAPVISSIVTNVMTGQPESSLINGGARAELEHQIQIGINQQTDATVTRVYFTNLAVQ